MNRKVRVRFAPSPTGPLHMGGVRTALYNFLFAKKHGGDFILRLEDTDQSRYVQGAEEYIIESLKWCGIVPNEGQGFGGGIHAPYRQSERKHLYKQYVMQLIENETAYYAFDTPEEIEAMRERFKSTNTASYNYVTREAMKNSLTLPKDEVNRRLASGEPYVIRIKIPRKEEIRVKDLIRGNVVVHSSQMDDKVLFKSDGMPTYHLANVVDDYLMEITHVIRGEEWLPSAPLHVFLYKCLGWEQVMPEFAHLPLLLKPEGNGKLSKRDGDRLGFPVFPLQWHDSNTGETNAGYREKGYFPEAFINMLALLGWNPGNNTEIMSLQEMINLFSIERISKSGAKFDAAKTKWFNQQYLRNKTNAELLVALEAQVKAHGFAAAIDYLEKVINLIKEKAYFINEFWELSNYFFKSPTTYDQDVVHKKWKDSVPHFISQLEQAFYEIDTFNAEEIEKVFKHTAQSLDLSPGQLMQIFRVCISGVSSGPALFETTALIGKTEIISRLGKALSQLKNLV